MPYKDKKKKILYDKKRYKQMSELYKIRANREYELNKEEIKQNRRNEYKKNRETIIKRVKKYRNNNLEKVAKRKKLYYYKVTKVRLRNEPNLRIKFTLRKRVWEAIKRGHTTKGSQTLELLGCSIEQIRQHLENQFINGMSWNNYGKWHIDHIKPIMMFDLTKLEEQKLAFNYRNLQPLWAIENLKKGHRFSQENPQRLHA